jgi:3-methyladenine DNA glycosylase AlkD
MTTPPLPRDEQAERLLPLLRAELAAAGDPARAEGARAYMKSAMPHHGVAATPQRAIFRRVLAEAAFPSAAAWRSLVLHLWRGARHREERYAALFVAGDRRAAAFQTMDALPLYEEIVVDGAWWDYVDDVAAHRLPVLLRRHREEMTREMLAWSEGADGWKRRAAILCQLLMGERTDVALLERCIEPSLGSREFFLRKAIGWALRHYARTDPDWVVAYVRAHAARLSPLSKREALKALLKTGAVAGVP